MLFGGDGAVDKGGDRDPQPEGDRERYFHAGSFLFSWQPVADPLPVLQGIFSPILR